MITLRSGTMLVPIVSDQSDKTNDCSTPSIGTKTATAYPFWRPTESAKTPRLVLLDLRGCDLELTRDVAAAGLHVYTWQCLPLKTSTEFPEKIDDCRAYPRTHAAAADTASKRSQSRGGRRLPLSLMLMLNLQTALPPLGSSPLPRLHSCG